MGRPAAQSNGMPGRGKKQSKKQLLTELAETKRSVGKKSPSSPGAKRKSPAAGDDAQQPRRPTKSEAPTAMQLHQRDRQRRKRQHLHKLKSMGVIKNPKKAAKRAYYDDREQAKPAARGADSEPASHKSEHQGGGEAKAETRLAKTKAAAVAAATKPTKYIPMKPKGSKTKAALKAHQDDQTKALRPALSSTKPTARAAPAAAAPAAPGPAAKNQPSAQPARSGKRGDFEVVPEEGGEAGPKAADDSDGAPKGKERPKYSKGFDLPTDVTMNIIENVNQTHDNKAKAKAVKQEAVTKIQKAKKKKLQLAKERRDKLRSKIIGEVLDRKADEIKKTGRGNPTIERLLQKHL
ncbi:hypothetical protein Pelo_2648 [Pelomyxa schiedti]|nr:hypothetical protein Pelo_2648 [Pelomyxa schiedti]